MNFFKNKKIIVLSCLALVVFAIYGIYRVVASASTNINSEYKYAWNENGGWLNFGSNDGGVMVNDYDLTGYAWSENLGWVSLNCSNNNSCATSNYKVANDGEGNLSGYAWSDTVGWINFAPTNGGVDIDSAGIFTGYAWSENVGWVVFNCQDLDICSSSDFKVKTSWRPISVRESGETEDLEISDVHFSSTDSIIVINWDTNHDANSHIRWGTDKNLEKEKNDSNREKKHRTIINNLEPSTVYFFRIKSTDENDKSDTSKIYSISTKQSSAIFSRRSYEKLDENKLTDENYEKVDIEVSDKSKNDEKQDNSKEETNVPEKTAETIRSDEGNGFFSSIFSFIGEKISRAASGTWNAVAYAYNGIYDAVLNGQRKVAEFIGTVGENIASAYGTIISKFSKEKAIEIAEENQKRFFTAMVFNRDEKKLLSEVKFQILDKSDIPVPNLETTLFSDPQTSMTDEDGIASFSDVPIGSHTLAFNYQGEEFEKKVAIADTLTEEGKVRAEVVQVKAEKEKISFWMWCVIVALILMIGVATYFGVKYSRLKKKQENQSGF